jgi:hypothetical protein
VQSLLHQNQIKVLTNLKHVLDDNNIPFVVIGGLAAIAWGVQRPLTDIDIQVENANLSAVKKLFQEYVTTDIRHYVTKNWDIQQMILTIDGVGIDVCGTEAFFIVKNNKRYLFENWIKKAVVKNVEDISLPTLPKEELIAYKTLVARPVDLQDLRLLGL